MSARRGPREITLEIEALGDDGLGYGHVDDREVRVRNALPGESVEARVLRRRRGVWYGEASRVEAPSGVRQAAPCPAFPRCGGCVLQHLAYDRQLEHKQAILGRALARAGVVARRWLAPVAGPRLHYRHRARLGVRRLGDELLAGFRESFSNRVARLSDCKVLALPFADALVDLRETLRQLSVSERIPQVEVAGGDRDFAVVVRHLDALAGADRQKLAGFARRRGLRVYLQSGGYDSVVPLDQRDGGRPLTYVNADFGLCFEFQPVDFIQVNPYVNRLLVRDAVHGLEVRPNQRVVDLFSGIGNFSLALARSGARVRGFESGAGAVARAMHNADLNGLGGRAEFAVADLYDARSPDLGEVDRMLLDPPRSGAGANLERWLTAPALQRVAYVSCNPQTFADDAATFVRLGFELQQVTAYDMFPHTAHVEALGLFQRVGAARG